MKNIILLLAIIFLASLVSSQEIKFENSNWKEIKAKAKKQNKLIFLDAFTSWCGPCKAMAKNTFTDSSVAAFYNAEFINAKIDMEKGEGPQIAKEYNVNCYPNLLFIDGDGKLVHRSASYMQPKDFISLGKTALSPEKTFSFFQKKYESGNSDPVFVSQYLNLLSHSCLSANDAAVKYFSSLRESEMSTPGNWGILRDFVEDVHSAPFVFLVKNRMAFSGKFTADSINDKIFNSYLSKSYEVIYRKEFDTNEVVNLVKEIQNAGIERSEELFLSIDLPYYQRLERWDMYFGSCRSLVGKYKQDDSSFLNNVSWNIFEKSTDKNQLAEAEAWAKRSVEIEEGPYNLDTWANLMFVNGKKQEAIDAEKKAISLAKAAGMETADMENTLAKFEGKK